VSLCLLVNVNLELGKTLGDEEIGTCLERLLGSARELCESPHGNYCLQLGLDGSDGGRGLVG